MSVLDASAILALVNSEPGQEMARDHLAAGAAVSAVNWSEVRSKLARFGYEAAAVEWTCRGITVLGLVVEPFVEDDARSAAQLDSVARGLGVSLSLADRACLALAARLDRPAITADRAWQAVGRRAHVPVVLIR